MYSTSYYKTQTPPTGVDGTGTPPPGVAKELAFDKFPSSPPGVNGHGTDLHATSPNPHTELERPWYLSSYDKSQASPPGVNGAGTNTVL